MSWLTGLFKPRQDNFIRLLIEQAAWVVKGLDALNAYVSTCNAKADEAKGVDSKSGGAKAADGKAGSAKAADCKDG